MTISLQQRTVGRQNSEISAPKEMIVSSRTSRLSIPNFLKDLSMAHYPSLIESGSCPNSIHAFSLHCALKTSQILIVNNVDWKGRFHILCEFPVARL